ncbi:tRNA lysidine(34) synthetase TilS [Deltaproteobacteria bacterium Smac51]|nr:tRNA lysidine(34) synthetase TilS [Deltaproteobacteria bacterium Smac51]
MARQQIFSHKQRFGDALRGLCPSWKSERFVVAFSGGLDSTALLRLAAEIMPPERIVAAHLNHRLRGQAADEDQRFAAGTAAELGIEFISAGIDVAALADSRGKGVEEAARRARYIFLAEAAAKAGAGFILTAHQADDQTETILMNFIRGAGAGGLAGIHPRRKLGDVELLRPLLGFSREDLKAFLNAAGQTWVEDKSNQDSRYRRNALRLDIIPRLKSVNPRLGEALNRSAAVLRSEEDFWKEHLHKLWPVIVGADDETANTLTLKRGELERLTVAERRRFIYEAFLKIKSRDQRMKDETGEPMSFATVEVVLEIMNYPTHSGLDLPGGLRAEVFKEELKLSPASRFI